MQLLPSLSLLILLRLCAAEKEELVVNSGLSGDEIEKLPRRNLVTVDEGVTFAVQCSLKDVMWHNSTSRIGTEKIWRVNSANSHHSGTYDCTGGGTKYNFKVFVNSPSMTVERTNNTGLKEVIDRIHDSKDKNTQPLNITLMCECKDCKGDAKWYHNGEEVVAESRIEIHSNGTLFINYVSPLDSGLYSCERLLNGKPVYRTVEIKSVGFVKHTHYASKNKMQGETVVISCEVHGYPTPTVTWKRRAEDKADGATDMTNETNRVFFDSHHGVANASLKIEKIEFLDRANYICIAKNEFGSWNETVLLRVKDKLAALWPFLGIVAEVVILVTIIFLYEKRKAKRDSEEDAVAVEQKRALTDDASVRQRAVKT